jgi:5'-methylthioadenosine phosphorylase
MTVPQCDFALIGGSSTLNIEVPESLGLDYVELKGGNLVFDTPWGKSPEFKEFHLSGEQGEKKVLTCSMHGWRKGVSRAESSRQVFWVLREAGVKRIIAEGGVGAINHLLKTRDLLIPHDYMDFSMRKDVGLEDRYLLVMRDAICPSMSELLYQVAEQNWPGRVFDRGIYVNTDGRHFESPAEVGLFKMAGGDVVGQSICPEVYLAREIGACYAGLYLVVNFAEGIIAPWKHEELADIYYNESINMAKIMLEFLRQLPVEQSCVCPSLRKETLLKKVYT